MVVLTRISLTDPTKELHFEYHLANKDTLDSKIREIEDRVIQENVDEYSGSMKTAPYKVGYINKKANQDRIQGTFVLWDDVFLVEEHTAYDFAYAISVRNIKNDRAKMTLFEH
jgi:hypothetical protein